MRIDNIDPPVFIELTADATAELRMVVDVPGFVQLMESKFVCKDTPGDRCRLRPGNPAAPCLDLFLDPSSTELQGVISFQ